ncbi:cardiolipin synthase [Acidithiobacillus sp.]
MFFDPMEVLLLCVTTIISVFVSFKVILYKREASSATLWLVVIWLLPLLGSFLYYLLGINRVRRKASRLRGKMVRYRSDKNNIPRYDNADNLFQKTSISFHLLSIARSLGTITERSLLPHNQVAPLISGEECYPEMLKAINGAQHTIMLATYIFHSDGIGEQFIAALQKAVERGVLVKVLLDGVMAHLTRPSIIKALKSKNIPFALFNSPLVAKQIFVLNLRSHRKIMVVDGHIGFTGGLNINRDYWPSKPGQQVFHDTHFLLTGPIVSDLAEVFADEWQYTTGESLRGDMWFPVPDVTQGEVLARGIAAGPDERFDRLRCCYLAALNTAEQSVRIMSPYFIPDVTLIAALGDAALRQVVVDIFIPEKGNALLRWATFGQLRQILEYGARIWLCPPPFDHSKLMIVDGQWVLLGSGNWDERSLRLNFEFNIECYDFSLAAKMNALFENHLRSARQFTCADLDARSLASKLRDGLARLFALFL